MRSSAVTGDLCRALGELNVVSWNCGFESGSDKILKLIKGNSASVAKHRELVRQADKFGVTLNGSFMFGIPGEKLDDMRQTLQFMEFLHAEKQVAVTGAVSGFSALRRFPGPAGGNWPRPAGKVGNRMDFSALDIKDFSHPLLLSNDHAAGVGRGPFGAPAS